MQLSDPELRRRTSLLRERVARWRPRYAADADKASRIDAALALVAELTALLSADAPDLDAARAKAAEVRAVEAEAMGWATADPPDEPWRAEAMIKTLDQAKPFREDATWNDLHGLYKRSHAIAYGIDDLLDPPPSPRLRGLLEPAQGKATELLRAMGAALAYRQRGDHANMLHELDMARGHLGALGGVRQALVAEAYTEVLPHFSDAEALSVTLDAVYWPLTRQRRR